MSLFTIIAYQLENAVIKTVTCVNLNSGQFQAITDVTLNATTRKGFPCLMAVLLGTTNDWSPIITGRMLWRGHCRPRHLSLTPGLVL
jgi:hypothetical protein